MTVLILGCGYAGQAVARLLAGRAERVLGTARVAGELGAVAAAGAEPILLDGDDPGARAALAGRCAAEGEGLRLLVAFPPARLAGGGERTGEVLGALRGRIARVVQLSSSVVYGDAPRVDAATAAAPSSPRGVLYLDAERAVREGPWSSLVLRVAAIYGPGRGLLADELPRFTHARSLDAVVSRIHVDDLAAIAVAALGGRVEGAWPVADEEPASGRELLAAWSGTPWERGDRPDPPGSRRVDGTAVARELGVVLRYRSYRDAIDARR